MKKCSDHENLHSCDFQQFHENLELYGTLHLAHARGVIVWATFGTNLVTLNTTKVQAIYSSTINPGRPILLLYAEIQHYTRDNETQAFRTSGCRDGRAVTHECLADSRGHCRLITKYPSRMALVL